MLLDNQFITIPLLVWVTAQLTKFLINVAKGNTSLKVLWQAGGMPSAHSATVTALFMTVLIQQGAMSSMVGIVAVFGAIVIYDAMGVRRESSIQADRLNDLAEKNNWDLPALNEHIGHTPLQVVMGVILGLVESVLLQKDKVNDFFLWLSRTATRTEIKYLLILAILIFASGAIMYWLSRGGRVHKIFGAIYSLRYFARLHMIAGILLAISAYFAYTETALLGAHNFILLILISFLVCKIWLIMWFRDHRINDYSKTESIEDIEKDKWLKRAKKK